MSNTPIRPFWSWNDKLEKEELENQIEAMHKAGIEGFFMHARGGLVTEYMGDEWFDMIKACADKAQELGMEAWAYDENGWPSGFADGIVPSRSVNDQQKWLMWERVDDTSKDYENLIGFYKVEDGKIAKIDSAESGCIAIYCKINPYYIDTFNPDTIDFFLESTHQKYYEKFGDSFSDKIKGFFTDEPQFGNYVKAPWSHTFPEVFKSRYGYDLISNLPYLYFEIEGYEAFRADFWNMVADSFRENFIKKMYDWCEEHDCGLTGHMMAEEGLASNMNSTAGVMACYEYFQIPGIDWLGRCISTPLVPKQLGSVAYQLGKKTLTESFALCGWDVSLNELKWIAQWQFVNGVTGLCPHLEGYSLRGYRKRDYPASLFTQLPWFDEGYPAFSKYCTTLGDLLDSGEDVAPMLVVHPLQTAYIEYNPTTYDSLSAIDGRTHQIFQELSENHILHHYGDEVIMDHHGKVENDSIKVGNCKYNAVLLPEIKNLKSTTVKLLLDFANNGGKIYALSFVPSFADGRETDELEKLCEKITVIKSVDELQDYKSASIGDAAENKNIHFCKKNLPDGTNLYYLVNHSKEEQDATLKIKGDYTLICKNILAEKDEMLPCVYENETTAVSLHFGEYSDLVIIAKSGKSEAKSRVVTEKINLDKTFEVTNVTDNCLTLDFCEYSVDGAPFEKEAVILLQNKLLKLQRPCDIVLNFPFTVEEGADITKLCLCVETPEKYSFELNGKAFNFVDMGYFTDSSIRKCDISDYVVTGENVITMKGQFYQSDKVYKVISAEWVHEVEKNKLTYDTELESIYLIGDFGVKSDKEFTLGDKKSVFTGHNFTLTKQNKTVDISNITVQDYWFFAGKMDLTQKVSVNKKDDVRYTVSLSKLHSPAAELFVNGKSAGMFAFAPFSIDVTDLLSDGENEITIRLLSGNRNLMGPHHRPSGEIYSVGPDTFTDVVGWSDDPNLPTWTDDYSFVLFGAEL